MGMVALENRMRLRVRQASQIYLPSSEEVRSRLKLLWRPMTEHTVALRAIRHTSQILPQIFEPLSY
jgi:hypothetical protein